MKLFNFLKKEDTNKKLKLQYLANLFLDNNYDLRWDLSINWKDILDNNQYSFDSWDDSMIEELIEEEPNWFED